MSDNEKHLIGTYPLGQEHVRLYTHSGSDARLDLIPPDALGGSIDIGLDYDKWSIVVSSLLHEAFEYALIRAKCRLVESNRLSATHSDYIFLMTHQQFDEICEVVSMFITPALPELAKIYNQHHNTNNKEEK